MGGSLCGIAAPLLVPAMQSTAAVIRVIEALKKEFVTVMFFTIGTSPLINSC